MTDDNKKVPSLRTQLLAAAREFSLYLPEPLEPEDCDELMHILEPVVTTLLASRERAVWEAAAKLIEDGVSVPYECGPDNWKTFKSNDCKRMAAMCRQQAKVVKP